VVQAAARMRRRSRRRLRERAEACRGRLRGWMKTVANTRLPADAWVGRLLIPCARPASVGRATARSCPRSWAFGRGFSFWRPESAQNHKQTGTMTPALDSLQKQLLYRSQCFFNKSFDKIVPLDARGGAARSYFFGSDSSLKNSFGSSVLFVGIYF
jgi:hypothetical protein